MHTRLTASTPAENRQRTFQAVPQRSGRETKIPFPFVWYCVRSPRRDRQRLPAVGWPYRARPLKYTGDRMTIDERLERLTERHEALTQSMELHEKRFEEIGEKIRTLAVIAEQERGARRRNAGGMTQMQAGMTQMQAAMTRMMDS